MNYEALDIAAWFVRKEPMNHEKLQCLLYLSYAWYWTLNQAPLFDTEGFEALPVLPSELSILKKYHHLGKRKIKQIIAGPLDGETSAFLESVYEIYGIADGNALCAYLRQSEPYLKARQREENFLISREDMIAYYEKQR